MFEHAGKEVTDTKNIVKPQCGISYYKTVLQPDIVVLQLVYHLLTRHPV
jgi:hypothetical protein